MRRADIRRAVLTWARTLDRPLPWRGERDPYRVLVSEVMLQQTQALRVVPFYEAFLRRFPTFAALADAPSADVLRAWGNLGYNRRALNLWRAARAIVDHGAFPNGVEELISLPGVGPYTARAVASFAFDADVGVVDANVRRVLTRFYGLAPDADVQTKADHLAPDGSSATWNQAMIDLGAEVCVASKPRCDGCPMRDGCAWNAGVRVPARRASDAPRFEETTRFARGRVVATLRASDEAMTRSQIVRRTALTRERVDGAIATLLKDGLVTVQGSWISLGVSEPSPAAARRR